MAIPETCCHCTVKTFVIFDGQPWCREHFLAEVDEREKARDEQAEAATAHG